MGWVEELKPEDEVTVEIIYPDKYVQYNCATMREYIAIICSKCQDAALLGEDEVEFFVLDMTIVQVYVAKEKLLDYGIKLQFENGMLKNGRRWTYFHADVRGMWEKIWD